MDGRSMWVARLPGTSFSRSCKPRKRLAVAAGRDLGHDWCRKQGTCFCSRLIYSEPQSSPFVLTPSNLGATVYLVLSSHRLWAPPSTFFARPIDSWHYLIPFVTCLTHQTASHRRMTAVPFLLRSFHKSSAIPSLIVEGARD